MTLEFNRPRQVTFTITRADLWGYRTEVAFGQHRWHENRTLRCTRELEKTGSASAAAIGLTTIRPW